MLSNYGYEDASGSYYIQIDTDKCVACEGKPCLTACPAEMFEVYLDDYDDEVVGIRETVRNQLKLKCVICKNSVLSRPKCMEACPHGAVKHSW